MRFVIGRSSRSRDRDLALSKAMAERLLLSCVLQLSLQIESRRLICEREIVLAMAVHVVQFQLRYSVLSLSLSLSLLYYASLVTLQNLARAPFCGEPRVVDQSRLNERERGTGYYQIKRQLTTAEGAEGTIRPPPVASSLPINCELSAESTNVARSRLRAHLSSGRSLLLMLL